MSKKRTSSDAFIHLSVVSFSPLFEAPSVLYILEEKHQKAKFCGLLERERCALKTALALMSFVCVQRAFMSTVFSRVFCRMHF
jgi:hypothetical protein